MVFLQSPLSLHAGCITNTVPHFASGILAEIPAKFSRALCALLEFSTASFLERRPFLYALACGGAVWALGAYETVGALRAVEYR